LNPRPKIQTYGVYMLVLSIDVARRLPDRRGGRQASLRKISPLSSHRQRVRSYPANRRPIRFRKNEPGGRWPSTKRPWHSHNHWQLCCFHLFYEQGGTSACNRNPDDPRRNRFAPFRFCVWEIRCYCITLIVRPFWKGFKGKKRPPSVSSPPPGIHGVCTRAIPGSSGCRPGSASHPRAWSRRRSV
jgi:hypothetical protein